MIVAMVRAEVRRLLASPMSVIAVLALTCVPLLYGGLYLWANYDPYAKLDQIPAAIVVEDAGATQGSRTLTYGDDVASQLVDDASFDWQIVDAQTAADGLATEEFDFAITFPEDFSDNLTSLTSTDPQRATVVLTTSDANSYLASTIGDSAAEKIRVSIVQTINEEAARTLLDALAEVRESLGEAVSGSQQIADGLSDAAGGSGQISSGEDELLDGLLALQEGVTALNDGAAQLADGSDQIAAGNAQLAETATSVGEAADDAGGALTDVRGVIDARLAESDLSPDVIAQVEDVLDSADSDMTDALATVNGVVTQIQQLSDGSAEAAAGAQTLEEGLQEAGTGVDALVDGAGAASDALTSLVDGLDALLAGSQELTDALVAGVEQLPESTPELRAQQAAAIANPVELDSQSLTTAGTYGAGLAPFFASLAAWIGVYALFLIVKPISVRAVTALRAPIRVTIAGWLTPAVFGLVQMTSLYLVLAFALGFDIQNPWGTWAMLILASATFSSIILALNVWLGSVGQFIGLILMVVQLVTAGGTFPWQTLPDPLVALHHVLPMSFAVDGMRQLMYGGSMSAVGTDVAVLLAVMVGALAFAAVGVRRMTVRRTMRDLAPSLIG